MYGNVILLLPTCRQCDAAAQPLPSYLGRMHGHCRLRMVAEEYISGRILALQSRPELEDMQFIMSQIVFTAWSTDPARLKMQPSLRTTASMLSKGGDADDLTPLLSQ